MDPSTVVLAVLAGFLGYRLVRRMMGKVPPERARALVRDGARLVDVRSPGEHGSGHIEGSINVPVGDLKDRLDELGERARPVVVYCASGMRSAAAADILKSAGFTAVHDLGAMARWSAP